MRDNEPCVWESARGILVTLDKGGLGELEHYQMRELAKRSVAWWNSAAARIQLQVSRKVLNRDVNDPHTYSLAIRDAKGIRLVFDSDGKIHEDLGVRTGVLGFTNGGFLCRRKPRLPPEPSIWKRVAHFFTLAEPDKAVVVINGNRGKRLGSAEYEQGILDTMTHELGHAIGLDHTQLGPLRPLMHPQHGSGGPRSDDICWLWYLYRDRRFNRRLGIVEGSLAYPGGQRPRLAVNVIARHRGDGIRSEAEGPVPVEALRRAEVYSGSCVSGFLADGTGTFVLPLQPGFYDIWVEPIRKQFWGGSGIGPYTKYAWSLAFDPDAQVAEQRIIAGVEVVAGQTRDCQVIEVDSERPAEVLDGSSCRARATALP